MTGQELAEELKSKGYRIKSVTRTSLVITVSGNRLKEMDALAELLHDKGAKVNSNLKGSSIGGIEVDKVKILIKAEGRTGGLDVEIKAINDLHAAVTVAMVEAGGPISIKLGGKTISGVMGVLKTPGTPKSDFFLHDINKKPLIHISHKKGSRPNDFQQWGGITEMDIINHKEVKEFITSAKELYGDRIPNQESVYKIITDKDLARMSVYGVGYNRGIVNPNRVDVLIQGDPGLHRIRDGVYELTATGHIHYLADIPGGGFTPVLACVYKGDRDQFGIRGARFSIYSKDGRKFKRQIK